MSLVPLEVQSQEVIQLWKQTSTQVYGGNRPLGTNEEIPTIHTLYSAVNNAQTLWKARHSKGFGKAKDRFFKFLEILDDHRYLFKFIPAGDKYVSLLTVVVSSIVTVGLIYNRTSWSYL